ncbi:ABC transporter permease [bacterium]|nr:ABC transporter permease [bacterium]HPF34400.1 ABC transporter permease [Candidatus Krumholzibacteria bacterium]HRX49824.1 ABC transporter permease [Candidatus Krumholzibacteria bacterium]
MNRMHAAEGVRQALHTIRGRKLRSGLLILGVAIGVATLLAITTIVGGLSGKIRNDIVSSAKPYLYVARFTGLGGEDMEAMLRRPQIMPECVEAAESLPGVAGVDYMVQMNDGTILNYGENRTNIVQVFGASDQFASLYSFSLGEGRFFTADDLAARRRVCVLGDGPRQTLFPKTDPVGKRLRIEGEEYEIVGAMASRRHVLGQMGDNFVVTPWTSYERDFLVREREDRAMAVTVRDGWSTDAVEADLVGALRKVRGLRPGQDDDFAIVASETYGELVDRITQGVALVLVVLSSIGLMVGGIGVMNIMLISVTERTREIGVRMAVGARRGDVLRQILVEAAVLTGLGGVVGVGLGYLGAWAATRLLEFPFAVRPLVVVVAVLFSCSIGVFFGLYPANRAARMDPVEALRKE